MSQAKGFIVVPAWVNNGQVKPLADDSGYIPISIKNWVSSLIAQGYSWNGTQWVKNPIPFGFYDVYAESVSNTSLPAGSSSVSLSAVPAGEVWVINSINAIYISSSITGMWIECRKNSINIVLSQPSTIASGKYFSYTGNCVLKTGDKIFVAVTGATLNDHLTVVAEGYKMKVTQV